jgi:CMP/dCMP kinase
LPHRKKIVIAIDGYSSCGKSTMAKQLAKELGYIYIDSGAMYRGITLYFLDNNIDLHNALAIEQALQNIHLDFINEKLHLNNVDVDEEIRTMAVANMVSPVAAIEAVRTKAVLQQQALGKRKGIVMDGRDIGTTVFPDAELKIFMTADIPVRVQRRWLEMQAMNKSQTEDEVAANLAHRDLIDSTREVSPLRQAADAILLDNSNLTMEQQLQIAKQWAMEAVEKYG